MKIRIHRKTLRLRLSQTEVELFEKQGTVKDQIDFGQGVMTYALQSSQEHEDLDSTFESNVITVFVPARQAQTWLTSDKVTLENEQQGHLKILVEKDFKCLHKRSEIDDADSYPHPKANV